MKKSKIIFLKMTVDCEKFDGMDDETILENSGIFDEMKDGIDVEVIDTDTLVDAARFYISVNKLN